MYYCFFFEYEIELKEGDFSSIDVINDFLQNIYKSNEFKFAEDNFKNALFYSISKYRDYCKNKNKTEHLKEIDRTWNILITIFGEAHILKVVKEYEEEMSESKKK